MRRPTHPDGLRLCTAALLTLCALGAAAGSTTAPKEQEPRVLRVAALYRGSGESGSHLLQGLVDATRAFKDAFAGSPPPFRVEIRKHPYGTLEEGVEMLLALLAPDRPGPDVIVGPTDSTVFLRALERSSAMDTRPIPIVSPLVAADVELSQSGWFVQVNANVRARAPLIAAYVAKLWPRSICVLHAATEYGRKAEAAFRDSIPPSLNQDYLPLQFDAPARARHELVARDKVRLILRERPEILGIFADSENVRAVVDQLEALRSSTSPYEPFLFTLVDIRHTRIPGMHLVSMVRSTPENDANLEMTDARALSHDTTRLILDLVQEQGLPGFRRDPTLFRDKLWDHLDGTRRIVPEWGKARTILTSAHGANGEGRLGLFAIAKDRVEPLDSIHTAGLETRLANKVARIYRSFGYWPFLYALMIFVAAFVLTYLDVKSWYQGRTYHLLNVYSLSFCLLSAAAVLALYVWLSETRSIRYDAFIPALLIALSPMALLRSTLFDTPTGRSIGLESLYRQLRNWIDEKIRRRRFSDYPKFLNVLAYYNDRTFLRQRALQANADPTRGSIAPERRAELDAAAAEAETLDEGKRVYARTLLRRFDWKQLTEMQLVPDEFRDPRDPGPADMIGICLRRIQGDPTLEKKLEEMYDEELETIRARDPGEHARILREQGGAGVTFHQRLTVLVKECRRSAAFFEAHDFLEPGWRARHRRKSLWDRLREWLGRPRGGLISSPPA